MRFNFLNNKGVLYFPGCYSSANLKPKIENYKKILKKLKIKTQVLDESFCCGGVLIEAGYEKQVRILAKDNLEVLKQNNIKKIITNDALCFQTFKNSYKDFLLEWSIEVEFILSLILKKLKENKNLIKNKVQEKIFLHDSSYLLENPEIHQEIRELLELLGFNLIEFENSNGNSLACGYEGGLKITNPEIANKIAKNYLSEIKRQRIEEKIKVITADPQAYVHLKENLRSEGNIEIIEISDVICKSLNLKIKSDN